jgi:hypothetical protein
MMQARRFHSVPLATNWYHTRRSGLIAKALLVLAGLQSTVVKAEADAPIAAWRHQRYVPVTVMEEVLKLLFQLGIGAIDFADDPGTTKGGVMPALAAGCEGAARLGVSLHA